MARLARTVAGMGIPVQYHQVSRMLTPPVDLSSVGVVGTSLISWTQLTPPATSVTVEASLDGGHTWNRCTNGGSIPGLSAGTNVEHRQLLIRATLETADPAATPELTLPLSVEVHPMGDEWVPLGVFWSTEWQAPDDTAEATMVARDRLEYLRATTYQTSQVVQDTNLYELAVAVLTDAGLESEEYQVDTALQAFSVPYAWFEPVSHREALRITAEAAMAQVYCDRDGVLRVEMQGSGMGVVPALEITPDEYFRVDNPMRPGQVANEVVVDTQPLRPAANPEEVYRSNDPVTVPAGRTVTLTVHYTSPPVIDAAAALEGAPPGLTLTDATYYGWGAVVTIHNAGGEPAQATLVITGRPLTVQNKERAIARDPDSITENGTLRFEFPANPLVQSLSVAQQIADIVLASAKDARRDLTVDWRGNPAVELGDRVTVRGRDYHVIRQEIRWAGALSGTTVGRRIPT